MNDVISSLAGGLIVSCQALPGEPLHTESGGVMPLMAIAAERAGAVGIRANSVRDITEIRAATTLPIIGIIKQDYEGFEPYITPTMREVDAVLDAGVDVVAVDATDREHPGGITSGEFLDQIRQRHPEALVMADTSTLDEALEAGRHGVDLVSTTLSGYTTQSSGAPRPDLPLVKALAEQSSVPVIAEGNITTPELAKAAIEAGAHAVVVGGAITRPMTIAERFVSALPTRRG